MDDTLLQFLEQEQEFNKSVHDTTSVANDNPDGNTDDNPDDESYEKKTKDYYKQLGFFEFLSAAYFTFTSCYICGIEYAKYAIGYKTKTNAIIDIAKRLAVKNMLYVKMFQAYATNRTILNDELNQFFSDYTDIRPLKNFKSIIIISRSNLV
jgi:hypothetical protein